MTRLPACILALALATLPLGAAQAASKPANPTPAYARCLATPTGQSTLGMIQCAAAELAIQDARLNRAYQAAIARLERPRQKAALQSGPGSPSATPIARRFSTRTGARWPGSRPMPASSITPSTGPTPWRPSARVIEAPSCPLA